ncbi:polysaccharide deacetylase family protein [Actinomadura soli]|uniref:Polysaccharide deacetylase family protein n=1 Tax=Actinomadura soli TaxID=2508997 RepID=A0A5C4J498_9ACTN|nr:polysaccharide deacetylase family protein [Actinomadura soli]TMQ91696.1 polysaccharide deacetylase family protein [Actinomadura soli]
MDGPNLVRRGAAAVLAAAICGGLSTLAPSAGRVEFAVAQRNGPSPSEAPEPARKPPPDCTRAKCVALTFDDGPAASTGELLDILAARRVKATFFLIGKNVAEYPELVRREHEAGHEIADHSYSHANLGRASKKKIVSELTRTQDAIRQASGVTPTMLRPPYGSTSRRLSEITREMGLAQVLWTVDPQDWDSRDTEDVERRVLAAAKPGYIVLMHDIHRTTVKAVPKIIDRLAAEGYVFVTVSELFGRRLTPGKEYVQLNSGEPQGLP